VIEERKPAAESHPRIQIPKRPRDQVDELVPDPQVAKELNISLMTVWRWDHDPELAALGWPPPVYIRKRKYRGRKLLEKFKSAALRRATRAQGT
jgi:hypothetical protein